MLCISPRIRALVNSVLSNAASGRRMSSAVSANSARAVSASIDPALQGKFPRLQVKIRTGPLGSKVSRSLRKGDY